MKTPQEILVKTMLHYGLSKHDTIISVTGAIEAIEAYHAQFEPVADKPLKTAREILYESGFQPEDIITGHEAMIVAERFHTQFFEYVGNPDKPLKTAEEILTEHGIMDNGIHIHSNLNRLYPTIRKAMEAYRNQGQPEPIMAKALRKKGTDVYYKFNGLMQHWDMVHTIPIIVEEYVLRFYPVPPDAELVNIEIRVIEEGNQNE